MNSADQKLANFAARMLRAMHDAAGTEVDAKLAQDIALSAGVYEWVTATEPCGSGCVCARLSQFPQDCLTVPEDVAQAAALLRP